MTKQWYVVDLSTSDGRMASVTIKAHNSEDAILTARGEMQRPSEWECTGIDLAKVQE